MTFYKRIALPLALLLLIGTGRIWAQEGEDDFTPGFSGYIQPMAGMGYSKSNTDVGDDNKRIDSLDQSARSQTEFIPIVLWSLGYTLDNGSTRFFAGTPEENIIEGTFLLELGFSQKLENGTILTAAYIPKIPGLDDEVWQDPFLLGSNRLETDRDSHAVRFTAASVFGSPFTIKYGFGTQDIENDQTGQYHAALPGSTLTSQDLQRLKRSGNFHQLDLQYGFDLGGGSTIQPGIYYMKGDVDGDANAFNRYGAKVSITRMMGPTFLFATLSMDYSDYDAVHPIFNETRNEWEYGGIVGLGYMEPFGWKNFMANLFAGVTKEDANISFYDSTSMIGGIGLTWTF